MIDSAVTNAAWWTWQIVSGVFGYAWHTIKAHPVQTLLVLAVALAVGIGASYATEKREK